MSLRDIRRQVGQLITVGFGGSVVPVELRTLAREFDVGGVILFARNIEAPEQVAELAYDAHTLGRDWPPWVGVDQEGGRVARLRSPFTEWPPMTTLGRSGDETLAERFATALAAELTAVGITLDFAPVLDVHTNLRNPVIGDRALSERADQVARLGTVIIRTLQANGVAACGKHFPGHGDTSADSHVELPVIDHAPDRLHAIELVPFRAAIASGVAALMTAHVLIPALDAQHPATLARAVVHDLLRTELGYDGIVATDDLEMCAITHRQPIETAAVGALQAGCDLLLLGGDDHDRQAAVLEALIHAVEVDPLLAPRVEDAIARQHRVKGRFLMRRKARPPKPKVLRALIGRQEHRAVADEMARYL